MQIKPFNSQAGFQSFSGNLVDQDNTSNLNFNNRTISNGWISNDEFTVIGDLNAQHTSISCNITGAALSITNLGTGPSIDANGNILSQKIFYANTSDTTEGGFREKSTAPGFWLEETGAKGAYAVLNSGSFQIQRRAENFGGYEASLLSIDLATAGLTIFGGITSNSYIVANGTGTSRIFRNSGGTVNGNITFDWADQYPQMVFRSGSTGRASILCDASLGHLYIDVSTGRNLYIRNGISGSTFLTANTAGITSTAPIFAPASTTSRTSLRVPHGSAPTVPTNGDIWSTTSGLFARINSSTYNLTNVGSTDLSPYTLLTTTSEVSAGLDTRINALDLLDSQQTNSINTIFSTYANTTTVADISAGLQAQISAMSAPSSATFVNDFDARYVSISGDTVEGDLLVSKIIKNVSLQTALRNLAVNPDLDASDNFGSDVAVYSDTIVVGAYNKDPIVGGEGEAYVFTMSGGQWVHQASLRSLTTNPAVNANDKFGNAVAIDRDTIVVAAKNQEEGGNDFTGNVYVFTRTNGVWSYQASLRDLATNPDLNDGDYFGDSVAIDRDTIVVGANNQEEGANTSTGNVYVFTRTNGVWSYQATLRNLATNPDLNGGDYFGHIVAIDRDTIVVGAPLQEEIATQYVGNAYVFTRTNGVWSYQASLRDLAANPDLNYGDYFGWGVSIENDTIVVGAAEQEEGGNSTEGNAYVFTRTNGVWSYQASLRDLAVNPDLNFTDYFGSSVSIENNTVVVGAWGKEENANNYTGETYIFTRTNGVWSYQASLRDLATNPDLNANDYFGHFVAIHNDIVVVAADNQEEGANLSTGNAYVFKINRNYFSSPNITISDLDGNKDEIVTLDANGKLVASGFTIVDLLSATSATSGGSAGTPLTVTYGATTVSNVSNLNFVGVASLTTPVAGTATVTISGGSGSGGGDPTVSSSTGQTFSPDGLSDVYDYTISSSSTVTLNAPASIVNGKSIIFKFTQPSGANAPLTLANGSGFTWKTPNGTLTLTTDTGSAVDIITVVRIGTNLYASIVKNLS